MPTDKTPVFEYLYDEHLAGRLKDGIVLSTDIARAIDATRAPLSKANPANFLKDIIRKDTANDNWPARLKIAQMTARQRYGGTKVFQFVPFAPGQADAFLDRFLPDSLTAQHFVQSVTVPSAARQLGRKEESWLMQVVVALKIIETQLSLFSPSRDRILDVTHLQMSIKTQPEIDAAYLLSYKPSVNLTAEIHCVATCEAKQRGERILEDQIREQVAVAFSQTKKIAVPSVSAIVPIAIQVRDVQVGQKMRRGIYCVEFSAVLRSDYDASYHKNDPDPERLYAMPLVPASKAIYFLSPEVKGIDA